MDKHTEHSLRTTLSLLQEIFGSYHPRDFVVRLWDGTLWGNEPHQSTRFTLVLQHPSALRMMFLPPSELRMGEAYIYDYCDIEGDIEGIFPMADYLLNASWSKTKLLRCAKLLLRLPASAPNRYPKESATLQGARHSKERDKQAIAYHYNKSNDFFALWLDQRMVYSCAYFTKPADDIDTAQEHKLEYICRKLRLHAGERLLDIGCGWGGLLMYASQRYGVKALGITVSETQAELANKRIYEAGLAELCRVEVRDYRDMKEFSTYDKLVSVGMFEHVGRALLPAYFKQAWNLLRPGGVFLNHGIALNISESDLIRHGSPFFRRYVFPDGELVPINITLHAAEVGGFEVRDVESLREHYVLTLQQWLQRLEEHADEVRSLTNEVNYRIWRLYMASGIYMFKANRSNIYQLLLAKPDTGESHLPLHRSDWYV